MLQKTAGQLSGWSVVATLEMLSQMFAVPNVWLAVLRVAAWLFWRDPPMESKPKRQPKPPRRPLYHFAIAEIPRELHSVVRTSWFKRGVTVEVDEVQIFDSPDAEAVFDYYVGQALRQGADVSVLSRKTPEELGIEGAVEI